MATLTIKNLPDSVYQKLKALASRNRRSINSEAIVRLEEAVRHDQTDEEELLQRIRALRADCPVRLTDSDLKAAIEEGRA